MALARVPRGRTGRSDCGCAEPNGGECRRPAHKRGRCDCQDGGCGTRTSRPQLDGCERAEGRADPWVRGLGRWWPGADPDGSAAAGRCAHARRPAGYRRCPRLALSDSEQRRSIPRDAAGRVGQGVRAGAGRARADGGRRQARRAAGAPVRPRRSPAGSAAQARGRAWTLGRRGRCGPYRRGAVRRSGRTRRHAAAGARLRGGLEYGDAALLVSRRDAAADRHAAPARRWRRVPDPGRRRRPRGADGRR